MFLKMPQYADFLTGTRLLLRSRFLSISFWLTVVVLVAAALAAQFSARQPATIALDVGLSLIRITLPIFGVLMLQELVSREFERKLFLTTLTYPRSRHAFLLGRLAALGILLTALLVVLAAILAGFTHWVGYGQGYTQATPVSLGLPYLVTIGFILLDLWVILALGTLLAVLASTPSFVLIGTLGFMLVARSYSAIVALLTRDSTLVGNADTYQSSLSLLGYLLPDLAALDVRMISLYGQWQFLPEDWALRVVSALAYAAALLGLSVWALNRKKFA